VVIWGQCYDHYFSEVQNFSSIFSLGDQCYDYFFLP
jgi:hypothetical protein